MSDSEEAEFWSKKSASQASRFLTLAHDTTLRQDPQESDSNSNVHSSSKKQTRTPRARIKVEKATSTTSFSTHPTRRDNVVRRSAGPSCQLTGHASSASTTKSATSSKQQDDGDAMNTDTDTDLADVEALVDTESEMSEGPSRGVSFAFSNIESRNGSMTSLSSTASVESRTGKKRTLEYVDTWNTPIASKSARIVHKPPVTSSTHTAPQTPSRAAKPPKAISSDSPSPYTKAVSTPTIIRVCDSFSDTMLDDKPGSPSQHLPTADENRTTGSNPPPGLFILAHSARAQHKFDALGLSWGVQYELARGVSNGWWTWDQVVMSDLHSLTGSNSDSASKVAQVVLGHPLGAMSSCDQTLWFELDREELAMCQGRSRGLGMQGTWMDSPNWYGGQIQQVARLEETQGSFRLVLAKMEMRKSHRFARFLGSRRMLQVSIPTAVVSNHEQELRAFFSQRFIMCGRTFVAFGSKDAKVFLMEIPEDYERDTRVPGDEQRITLEDFVNWHNPLSGNGKQPVSKWATRFDLGFSISVPAIEFSRVFRTDDQYAPYDMSKKAPAECIYTDGCGYMNAAALTAIARHLNYSERPTAVQGRIGGAKGLWILHPRDQTTTPKIWIRESQVKVHLDPNQDPHPAHKIFDLLAPPRVTIPSRLSRLTILNLAHNGVPTATLVEMMRDTLDAEVQPLTQWDGPKAMPLLWRAVEKVGGVALKRVMQHALGATRALGLSGRIREEDAGDAGDDGALRELADAMEDPEDEGPPAASALRDPVTGEPLTIHAVVMDLLQAGFQPNKLGMLYDKLKKIVTGVIEDIIRDFHISIPLSAEAFIVPDPYGVLEEGEIHFKSTKELKDPCEDVNAHIILGDVLIYRNPNRLPSDVRKVKAVQHDKLAEYTNVIVLPVKGPCSFASVLAGGDYDGDVCVCIYDPKLVDSFKNSEISRAPDNFLRENFEDQGTIQQVSAMAGELIQLAHDPDARRRKLQESLLAGLSTTPVGQYSKFHENAVYMHGYDAPEAIRNALMFNTVLDSRKTGLRVKQDVRRSDKRKYDRDPPECLKSPKSADLQQYGNFAPLRRDKRLGCFVLDDLLDAGRKMLDKHMKRYDELVPSRVSLGDDCDLLRPYNKVQKFLDHPSVGPDLADIRAHIEKCIGMWQAITRETHATPKTPSKRAARPAASGSGKSQRARWDELAREFAGGPAIAPTSLLVSFNDVELLKASWAYSMKPNFAWKVAFQALCRIKAATRKPVAVTGEFSELMSITRTAGRVLEQSRLAVASTS